MFLLYDCVYIYIYIFSVDFVCCIICYLYASYALYLLARQLLSL